jgi:cell division protein FtsW
MLKMEDSIYRLKRYDILSLCVTSLLLLGILMVQSASMSISGQPGWKWSALATRHALFAGIGFVTFLLISRIDYRKLLPASGAPWRNPILAILVVAAVLCALVLVPGVGIEKNGARRWLSLGFTQLQPSELAKWATVLYLAWWLISRPDVLQTFGGFVRTMVPVGVLTLLVVIHDFGTAALIAACALTLVVVARVRFWHLLAILPPVLGIAFWFVYHREYRWKRMTAFLDPFNAPQTEGYHMIQSLLSFASGGLSGKGLGNGVQKLGYLPEDTTDFIFSVIAEEMGLFGAVLTVSLYLGILLLAWTVIRQPRDSFGRILALGIASMIGLQAVINISVTTVSVPTKGLSLPLISYGGSGLIITCAALGLLGSILRHHHDSEPAAALNQPPQPGMVPQLRPIGRKLWHRWTLPG